MEREIIDLEKERKEKENTPEGKRAKRIRTCLGIVAAAIFFAIVYVINHNPNARKDLVAVSVQGVEIIPGETKVQTLLESGFSLAEQQATNEIDPEAEAEANSYYSMIFLVKDKEEYGLITIANDANRAQPIPECIVLKIAVYDFHEGIEEVTVDGVAMSSLTYEDLIDTYGEPAKSEESTYSEGTELEWEKNEYFFSVTVGADKKIHYVQSAYGHY